MTVEMVVMVVYPENKGREEGRKGGFDPLSLYFDLFDCLTGYWAGKGLGQGKCY